MNVQREGMGSPGPRKMQIQTARNNRAEQDWQDARSERPATAVGPTPSPRAQASPDGVEHLRHGRLVERIDGHDLVGPCGQRSWWGQAAGHEQQPAFRGA